MRIDPNVIALMAARFIEKRPGTPAAAAVRQAFEIADQVERAFLEREQQKSQLPRNPASAASEQ